MAFFEFRKKTPQLQPMFLIGFDSGMLELPYLSGGLDLLVFPDDFFCCPAPPPEAPSPKPFYQWYIPVVAYHTGIYRYLLPPQIILPVECLP